VTSTRRLAAVAALALSSLVVACGSSGNGEDGKSADQIVSDAKAALGSATAFHLVGNVVSDSGKVAFDMKVDDKNTTSGSITQDGVTFDFVNVGGKLYFRSKALWQKAAPSLADTLGDQWVTVTGNSQLESNASSVTALGDASQLADQLGSSGGPYTKGSTKTVDGQQAIAVTSKDGEMDVALTGKPYPLHFDGGSHGTIDISEYGSHFSITAPSKPLDLSSLQASSSDSSASSSSSDTGTKEVVDATKVRDGVLQVAEGTITSGSGSVDDAWGVQRAVGNQLPASVEVAVQTGDTSGLPPATPTKIVLYATQTSSGDLFMVVVADASGNCEIGALTGNPPNGNPQSKTLPAGTDCTAANALDAFNS